MMTRRHMHVVYHILGAILKKKHCQQSIENNEIYSHESSRNIYGLFCFVEFILIDVLDFIYLSYSSIQKCNFEILAKSL